MRSPPTGSTPRSGVSRGRCRPTSTRCSRSGCAAAVIESPVSDGKLAAYGISRESCSSASPRPSRTRRATASPMFLRCRRIARGPRLPRARVPGGGPGRRDRDRDRRHAGGGSNPEAAALLVRSARGWVGQDVPVHWHGHNDFGLATAAAVAAVRAGAAWVQGTINGMGERAGNANLGEVALALEALYGVATSLRFGRLREVSEMVQANSPATSSSPGSP